MRDVVATGLGVVARGAGDVPAFWNVLKRGQAITAPPSALPDGKIRVAEVTDLALTDRLPVKAAARSTAARSSPSSRPAKPSPWPGSIRITRISRALP